MEYQQSANYQQSMNNLPTASEKMQLWSQAAPYMTDSGYTTQAPSISSIDAFLNDEQMDTVPLIPQQIPSRPDWEYNNNNNAKINVAPPQLAQPSTQPPSMTQIDDTKITSLNTTNRQQLITTAPQSQNVTIKNEMQQPIEESDNALQNWMNYQDNSEMALKAIPDLIKLLNDDDLLIVSQAAILVNQMSKKKNACLALIESNDCVTSLVNCLANDTNIETAKNVVGTFYNISLYPQGINRIINSNAIQALVNLLTVPMETVVSYAITTLHNVLLAYGEIKVQLRKFASIQKMVPLLNRHTNAKFLAIVVDCLQLLSHGHQESKMILLECGGPELLVDILRNSNYPKLILMTTRLLKVLSVCTHNKKALINFGAMQALSLHLNNASTNELQNCLITLRNLSDAATKINGLEDLIKNLINIISSSQDEVVSTLAAGILSNLTCNNEMNKLAVLRFNGIPLLLQVIEKSLNKVQLIEPLICTLRHITNRYSEAARAQEQIKIHKGFELIVNLLMITPRKWPILKATLGLLRNFTLNLAIYMQLFKQHFIIEKLMQILFDAFQESQQRQVIDDINLFDIMDVCSSILAILVKDAQNQMFMKQINCIQFISQLFYSPVPIVQRVAATLLAELVVNKECIEVIEQQEPVHMYLNKFMANPSFISDAALINGCKTIIMHINEHKANKMRLMQQQMNGFNPMMQQQAPPNAWNNQQFIPQPTTQQQQMPMGDMFPPNDSLMFNQMQQQQQQLPIYQQQQPAQFQQIPPQYQQQQKLQPTVYDGFTHL